MGYNFIQIIIAAALLSVLIFIYWRINLKRLRIYKSPLLGKIEVLQKYDGEKVLTTNSYIQGVSVEKKSIKKSYWYAIAEETVKFCLSRKNPQVLMLGLGANTISNLIAELNPSIQQVIVEFDQLIIQACREFFGLDNLKNYQLIKADAYQLANQKKPFVKKFDVIIVDIFTGSPPYVSIKSNQPGFIEKILTWLKKDGMMVFNRPGHNKLVKSDSQKLKKYLDQFFKQTEIIDIKDPRGFKNSVILGRRIV